jgi:N-methylcarbamate hydrolase
MSRRRVIAAAGVGSVALLLRPSLIFGGGDAGGPDVEPQPYFAGVNRAVGELAGLGAPLAPQDAAQIAAMSLRNDRAAVGTAEAVLDRYTLARLAVDAGGSAHLSPGGAPRTLVEQGWRMFLVRVENPSGKRDGFELIQAGFRTPGRMLGGNSVAQRSTLLDTLNKGPLIEKMWIMAQLHETTPIIRYGIEIPVIPLSGSQLEYHVVQVFSRDRGQRRAELVASTFPADLDGAGSSASRMFDFDCMPTRDVLLAIKDADGRGCVASLTVTDRLGLVYPPQAMRLAPDLYFQRQVYRADGESLRLPDGDYTIESRRGPEYLVGVQAAVINSGSGPIEVKLERWIDPARWGWYSGDTHIHAGGCAHYQVPTEGVSPETMIRHVRGEGLSIGDVLSWAPSWYYQKQFFTGRAESPAAVLEHPELQAANNASLVPRATQEDTESLLRYDVEVSGFPSSHAGHLVLLRLRDEDYPGTKLIEDWPSWNLPILKWARAQGAVAGYAHCGNGMVVDSTDLPNYLIPPMDGIGTQEAIIDVTHGAVDFLSGCDTRPAAELNAWYHMLNCGFRLAMIGETDFPCITGDRPGVGRSYVRLDGRPEGDGGYEAWIRGLREGRLYCGDGRSHFLDFTVEGKSSGGDDVALAAAGRVKVEATVAARLEPQATVPEATRNSPTRVWHLENARIGGTRNVAVELVVNGVPAGSAALLADGTLQKVSFDAAIERSSWVALRILPSSHTHPVFVCVGGGPIRASRRSAQWCRDCVDKVWEVKAPFMRESERPAAAQAFDHARAAYDAILKECTVV